MLRRCDGIVVRRGSHPDLARFPAAQGVPQPGEADRPQVPVGDTGPERGEGAGTAERLGVLVGALLEVEHRELGHQGAPHHCVSGLAAVLHGGFDGLVRAQLPGPAVECPAQLGDVGGQFVRQGEAGEPPGHRQGAPWLVPGHRVDRPDGAVLRCDRQPGQALQGLAVGQRGRLLAVVVGDGVQDVRLADQCPQRSDQAAVLLVEMCLQRAELDRQLRVTRPHLHVVFGPRALFLHVGAGEEGLLHPGGQQRLTARRRLRRVTLPQRDADAAEYDGGVQGLVHGLPGDLLDGPAGGQQRCEFPQGVIAARGPLPDVGGGGLQPLPGGALRLGLLQRGLQFVFLEVVRRVLRAVVPEQQPPQIPHRTQRPGPFTDPVIEEVLRVVELRQCLTQCPGLAEGERGAAHRPTVDELPEGAAVAPGEPLAVVGEVQQGAHAGRGGGVIAVREVPGMVGAGEFGGEGPVGHLGVGWVLADHGGHGVPGAVADGDLHRLVRGPGAVAAGHRGVGGVPRQPVDRAVIQGAAVGGQLRGEFPAEPFAQHGGVLLLAAVRDILREIGVEGQQFGRGLGGQRVVARLRVPADDRVAEVPLRQPAGLSAQVVVEREHVLAVGLEGGEGGNSGDLHGQPVADLGGFGVVARGEVQFPAEPAVLADRRGAPGSRGGLTGLVVALYDPPGDIRCHGSRTVVGVVVADDQPPVGDGREDGVRVGAGAQVEPAPAQRFRQMPVEVGPDSALVLVPGVVHRVRLRVPVVVAKGQPGSEPQVVGPLGLGYAQRVQLHRHRHKTGGVLTGHALRSLPSTRCAARLNPRSP